MDARITPEILEAANKLKNRINLATGKDIIGRLKSGYSIIIGLGVLHMMGPSFRMIVIQNGYRDRQQSEVRSITVCPTLSRDELIGVYDSSKERLIDFLYKKAELFMTDLPTIIDCGCVLKEIDISMFIINVLTGYDNGVGKLQIIKEFPHRPIDRLAKEMESPLYASATSDKSGHLSLKQASEYYNQCFWNFDEEATAFLAITHHLYLQNQQFMTTKNEILQIILMCGPGRFAKYIVDQTKKNKEQK